MNFLCRTLLLPILIFQFSQLALIAQNDSYARENSSQSTDSGENIALQRGNFTFGSGFGYVNAVTTIQIDNGGTIQKGGNKGFQLHLTPTIGYFITRNFVFGLGMDYLISSSENNNDNTVAAQRTSDTKLLFGPYSRIYFPFAGDQALFIGGYMDTESLILNYRMAHEPKRLKPHL
jgi:hypothetical protein